MLVNLYGEVNAAPGHRSNVQVGGTDVVCYEGWLPSVTSSQSGRQLGVADIFLVLDGCNQVAVVKTHTFSTGSGKPCIPDESIVLACSSYI